MQTYTVTYSNGLTITLDATSKRQARTLGRLYATEQGCGYLKVATVEVAR